MSVGDRINQTQLERLRARLSDPAAIGQIPTGPVRAAAVLMPIFERAGELHLVFIRRSDRVESHRGQVAFPGGRVDPTDDTLVTTALREAWEEVAIEPAQVEILGGFEGATARVSNIFVVPFVGVIPSNEGLRPDPSEVAEIFDVPISAIRDRRFRREHRFVRDGVEQGYPAVIYGGQTIWGLTLRFVEELLVRMDGRVDGRIVR